MATHSLVTIPVVSQSQNRQKTATAGCKSNPRCACPRCKNTVTETIVMWVSTKVTRIICHHENCSKPPARKLKNSFIEPNGRVPLINQDRRSVTYSSSFVVFTLCRAWELLYDLLRVAALSNPPYSTISRLVAQPLVL